MLLAPAPEAIADPTDYAGAIVTLQSLGELLATARTSLNLTASAQAQQIGISAGTLTNLSSPDAKPSYTTIIATLRWLSIYAP